MHQANLFMSYFLAIPLPPPASPSDIAGPAPFRRKPMATLVTIPAELLLQIAAGLPVYSKFALSRASRGLYELLPIAQNEKLGFLYANECAPLSLACAHCIRMLPAYHFSLSESRPFSNDGCVRQRRCLKCWQVQAVSNAKSAGIDDLAILQGTYTRITWIKQKEIILCRHCGELVVLLASNVMSACCLHLGIIDQQWHDYGGDMLPGARRLCTQCI